jgi:hypothetical protein
VLSRRNIASLQWLTGDKCAVLSFSINAAIHKTEGYCVCMCKYSIRVNARTLDSKCKRLFLSRGLSSGKSVKGSCLVVRRHKWLFVASLLIKNLLCLNVLCAFSITQFFVSQELSLTTFSVCRTMLACRWYFYPLRGEDFLCASSWNAGHVCGKGLKPLTFRSYVSPEIRSLLVQLFLFHATWLSTSCY